MKKTKQPNLKARLILLQISSFLVSVTPVLIVVIINWSRYTKTPGDTVKLCIGGALALFFVFLKAIGKLHMPRRVACFSVVFILSYLLKVIVQDLILLSGMALLGEVVDLIGFQKAIKLTKENMLIGKTANATTKQIKEVMEEFLSKGGRV